MITESARNYHRQSVQIFTWFLGEITKGDIVVNNAPKNYSFEYPKPLTTPQSLSLPAERTVCNRICRISGDIIFIKKCLDFYAVYRIDRSE